MKRSDFGSAISCIDIREGVLAVTAEVIWRSEAAVKPSYGAVKMLTMLQGSRALSPSLPAEGVIGHGCRSRGGLLLLQLGEARQHVECGRRPLCARQRRPRRPLPLKGCAGGPRQSH